MTHGGKREGAGRRKGVANVATETLKQRARKYAGTALKTLADICAKGESEAARVSAANALLDQEYGIKAQRATKGNRSFTTFDGSLQVKVCVADQIAFGPELQSAKKLLDELIMEKAKGADSVLIALVNQAFNVNKEGKVDTGSILALRRLEVDDPRWADIVRAIDDSIKVFGSKSYLRFYRKSGDGRMTMIPLDLASITPSPAAFARKSLRRRVVELEAELAEANALIATL